VEDLKRRVLEKVDENWEREVQFLGGLVRRPSTLGDEALVQRFVAEELGGMGLKPDVWQVDQAHPTELLGHEPLH